MRANQQRPEKSIAETTAGRTLDVHSIFATIQGEGPFAGTPAVFVRLGGCNLQCPWCDTEYTQGRVLCATSDVVQHVMRIRGAARLVVVTGGEPMRQNIAPLCSLLVNEGMRVQIETNGVLPVSDGLARLTILGGCVTLVVSPKTSRIHETIGRYATAFKYVVQAGFQASDGLPTVALGHKATPHVARPPIGYAGTIYVNPMDSKDDAENLANMRAAISACMTHGYTLGLQIHKIIDMP